MTASVLNVEVVLIFIIIQLQMKEAVSYIYCGVSKEMVKGSFLISNASMVNIKLCRGQSYCSKMQVGLA